jgi:hypothetical protein
MIATLNLKDLPATSQLWIYQCDRKFTAGEALQIEQDLDNFVMNWESHGSPITGAYQLINEQFILIAADATNSPSGCSIDSSVKIVREIEAKLGCSLLNKGLVAFEGDGVELISLPDIPAAVNSGKIQPSTTIFNNSINTVGQYLDNWKIPASDSWMKRYF